ncbi:MAG: NAD(P)H-hydrate dehydratase, partial [Treponema sp.]|nr:NAD(P)H-hydrate dehydratase [Treponema sp.]
NFDQWEPGMPIVKADCTLAIEPRKYCIFTPAARPYAGIVLPVNGIFPDPLVSKFEGVEFLDWEKAGKRISRIPPDAYKYKRGTVEIRAGSPGASGAALIAARGAQAAGAGLIRLVADDEIYPILASQSSGIMVAPGGSDESLNDFEGRFKPDAILLGPGWGLYPQRTQIVNKALALEKNGTPLVLDADALTFVGDHTFSGRAILTPHPGEFGKFTGLGLNEFLSHPAPVLLKYARERNAVIVLKSHVITIAAPDGRLGVIDGMTAGLAAGGSGDLLAGFCSAIAARMIQEDRYFDAYTCAAAAASLLIASGKTKSLKNRFTDPLEIADVAAGIAGEAWLDQDVTNVSR